MKHCADDDLILYHYGEAGRRRGRIGRHLDECPACAAAYRDLAESLALIAPPAVPSRGETYGVELWRRLAPRLPAPEAAFRRRWFRREPLALAACAALVLLAAFVAGRFWPVRPAGRPAAAAAARTPAAPVRASARERILLATVADHFDRSGRVLADIVNAPAGADIAAEQQWAEDLLTASRLYRQDAADLGERSIASVLDELERSLLDIVHGPSRTTAASLERVRRQVDAAALLFKVRVLGDELRQRNAARPARGPTT